MLLPTSDTLTLRRLAEEGRFTQLYISGVSHKDFTQRQVGFKWNRRRCTQRHEIGKVMDSMLASRYLILSSIEEVHLNDLGNGYIREFVQLGARFMDFQTLYLQLGQRRAEEEILKVVRENHIDVIFYMAGPADFHFSPDLFKRLQANTFTVMAVGDTEHFFDLRDIYYAQCMDLVVVYGCYSRYRYLDYGIDAISFYSSYDKSQYCVIKNLKQDIDISFVGNLPGKYGRKDCIAYILEHGFDVQVYGIGSSTGPVSLKRMVEIFNGSKINLSFNGITMRNPLRKEPNIKTRVKQMKGRIAEIALCGGFVLSEYVPGIEEVFVPGMELVVFHSKEDMIRNIKHYLHHEEERWQIAMNGHRRALKDYEVSAAIPRLIRDIEGFIAKKMAKKEFRPKEIVLDESFLTYYATFRFAMIVEFVKLRRCCRIWEELAIILKCRRLKPVLALKHLANISPNLKSTLLRIWRKAKSQLRLTESPESYSSRLHLTDSESSPSLRR